MIAAAPAPPQVSDFVGAINALVNAHSQNSRKNVQVREWFQKYFGEDGRASVVAEAKQAYNRPIEQFKHMAPHVVFVYHDNDTLETLKPVVQKKAYPGLKTVLFIRQDTEGLKPTDVMMSGASKVLSFYNSAFPTLSVKPLAPAATDATKMEASKGVDWNVGIPSDPCGLIGLGPALQKGLAALRAGKHVIFVGPPGTGKTEIARCLCNVLNVECDIATATSEWTTFDTIGGYFSVPTEGAGSELDFSPGIVLRAIESDRWLVIDEINRADIDKAFGELFTTLGGVPITLPYRKRDGTKLKDVVIGIDDGTSQEPNSYPYLIGPDWRILGTMNTFDKASLYQLSFAFMRRFAFVNVDVPSQADYLQLLQTEGASLDEFAEAHAPGQNFTDLLGNVFAPSGGKGLDTLQLRVGPAIAIDAISYLKARVSGKDSASLGTTVPELILEALVIYLFPQFEGRDQEHESIVQTIAVALGLSGAIITTVSERLATWTGFRKPLNS